MLSTKLWKLVTVCQKNLHHVQKLQNQGNDKGVKPRSYVFSDKVWLNSKYIKTIQNQKFKAKFFKPFWVLHCIDKKAYKLKLPKRWRIHDVFYLSLLEQNTPRKEWLDKKVIELEFKASNSRE